MARYREATRIERLGPIAQPGEAAGQMTQVGRAFPRTGKVAEGAVEGAAELLAVTPRQWEPAGGDAATGDGQVDLIVGQPEEYVGVGLQRPEEVDLVVPLPRFAEMRRRLMRGVDDIDGEGLCPRVPVEAGPDHRSVLGPGVAGVGRRMHAEESE